MNKVQNAVAGIRAGTGTYEALKDAVRGHTFTSVQSDVRSLRDLANNWEFAPTEGSFRDTIEILYWEKVLTEEQVEELREIANRTE